MAGLLSAACVPVWVLPVLVALAGLALLVVPGRRYLGQALLIATAVAARRRAVVIAGSARFPGAW